MLPKKYALGHHMRLTFCAVLKFFGLLCSSLLLWTSLQFCLTVKKKLLGSLLGTTGVGNVIMTAVFPRYQKGTRHFIAVTSNHIYLPDSTPLSSQHRGTCKVME